MKDLIASIYAVCLSSLLWAPIFVPHEAKADFIINPFVFDSAVPALPTTNLVVNLAADGDVYNTGTTQATDGQTVATWVDAAGTAQNVTAAGTDQPIWRAGGGVPYVEFDGNDMLRYASGAPTTGDAITMYVVMQTDSIATVQVAAQISWTGAASRNYQHVGLTTNPANGTVWYQTRGDTTAAFTARSTNQAVNNVDAIIHGNNNAADSSRSSWINNGGIGTDTNTGDYSSLVVNQYTVGAAYAGLSEQNNWDGRIYHVLIYDEEHDASERADTIAYLQDKWGL